MKFYYLSSIISFPIIPYSMKDLCYLLKFLLNLNTTKNYIILVAYLGCIIYLVYFGINTCKNRSLSSAQAQQASLFST